MTESLQILYIQNLPNVFFAFFAEYFQTAFLEYLEQFLHMLKKNYVFCKLLFREFEENDIMQKIKQNNVPSGQ